MSTAITNDRIQQEFITALFNENTDRDILLQSQKIINDDNKALIAILSGLQDHSHILRQQVFETVRENLDDFISLYTGCHQVHEKLDGILTQCQQEQQNSMDNDQDEDVEEEKVTISKTLYTYHDTIQRVTQNEKEIQVLEKIQQLVQEMEECEQEIRSIINNNSDSVGELMQNVTRRYLTIHNILSKQQLFNHIDNYSTIAVSHLLDEKCTQLKSTLVTTLEDKLTSTIIYQDNSTMQVYPHDNARVTKRTYLLDIFECYYMLDILSAEMAKIKRSLFKNIITPLFDHSTTTRVLIQDNILTLEQEKGGQGQDEDTNGKSAPEIACQVIHNIDLLLKFISEHIFDASDKNTRLFGNLILPEIFQQIIQQALSPAIPPTASELATFDPVTKAIYTLEHNCIQYYHFLDINNSNNSMNEPSTIINYVNNMDTHFATKRRDKLLLKGREVMLRRLYDVEEVVDMDKKTNKLQRYQITQTPKLLAMLLIDTVKEANSLFSTPQASSSSSAYQLLNVVHDLLDLFRAIMPQFHRSQFLSSPKSALIFRNDCYWLANTLTSDLIPELDNNNNNNNEELLTKKHVFHEAIDNVRILGESWFELAMAQWVRVLQNALNQTGKFINIAENRQRQQDCDHAIAQVIDQIRSYAVTLRPVISERLYFDLVSRVVDSVLTHLLGDIEDLQDIGAEDSHLIAQSLNSLIQLVDVFDSKEQGPATEPMVMQRVPSWRKFWFLKDMLDMNLRDIMDHYRRGELFMFEKKELIGLICALFAETDLRASMIREIQSTDPSPSMLSPSTSPSPPIEQRQQEQPTTPKTSLLAMVQPDQEEEEVGEGWGWDDEPIISSHNHHNKKEGGKSTTNNKFKSNQLSMQLDDHEESAEGWGFDDGDEEPILSQQEDKISKDISNSKKSSPLSMQLDDHEEDGEGWGFDDDEPLVIQQDEENPKGQQQPNKAEAVSSMPLEKESSDKSGWELDDGEPLVTLQQKVEKPKESLTPQKQSPLSMQLDHNDEEEGEGWGFDDDDDEPLIIPQQEHEQGRSEKIEHIKQKDGLPLLSNPNSTTSTSSMMDLDQQQQDPDQFVLKNSIVKEDKKEIIPERLDTTTSSSLSMMQEDEDDVGWGDADEDVNFSHVH